MNNSIDQIRKREITWRTRRRAWLFGFAGESVFGLHVARITDGEAFKVYDVWDAGIEIPQGESKSQKCIAWSDECTEFFLAAEVTEEDLRDIVRLSGARTALAGFGFWLEPLGESGKDGGYRVRYVIRKGTTIAEILVLKDKLDKRSRGLFMKERKKFNLAEIRKSIDEA